MSLFNSPYFPRISPNHHQSIAHTVYDAIWPYHPGEIRSFADFDIIMIRDRLTVEVERFPAFPYEILLDRDVVVTKDAWNLLDEICADLFEFYRNLPRIEPEDNIILGEN